MKKIKFIIALVLFVQALYAQKTDVDQFAAIDNKALQMPDSVAKSTDRIAIYMTTNFKSDKEIVRAAYVWLASNIQFDVEKMYATNFYESNDEKITKPLITRKGNYENYAAMFADICTKARIKSYLIEGYTRKNGTTEYIPSAWCAAMLDGSWFMFDPTQASGYIKDGKFVKKLNNDYFKVSPEIFIKSNIPFDYLWQFLNYPITFPEFDKGNTQINKAKDYFVYSDSIRIYEKQNYLEKLISSKHRIEKNGDGNTYVLYKLEHLKIEIEKEKRNAITTYNSAVADYNSGISMYNDFIDYKNKEFTPEKSDTAIQNMIDASENKLKLGKSKLDGIKNPDEKTTELITQLSKSIRDALVKVSNEQAWLKDYFTKGKSGRKSMLNDKKGNWN